MLGRQHLMLSVASVSVLVAPFMIEHPVISLTVLAGAAIGSLIPDVDASDAAVFHEDIRGLNTGFGGLINNIVGPVLPVFGYTTKYAVYMPAVRALSFFTSFSFEARHRAFTHSITGVFTMTALTGLYISAAMAVLGLFTFQILWFLTGYAVGAFLHLFQDSCTRTGINWNHPFSTLKLRGRLSTGKDIRKPRYFLYWLGGLTAISLYTATQQPATAAFTASASLLGLSWLIFFKAICRGKIEK